MSETIYAAFNDSSLAERAAGALLDHGVRAEDISVVRSHDGHRDESSRSGADVDGSWGLSEGRIDTDIINPGGAAGGTALNDLSQLGSKHKGLAHGQRSVLAGSDDDSTYDRVDRANDDRGDDVEDDIEDSAKYGISTTTGKDAEAGALKGSAIGLGVGAVAALASLMVPGVGFVIGGGALAVALGGLAATAGAGAAAGAVTGYLKDQGVDEHVAVDYDSAVSHGGALLAVQAPSGDVAELQIQEVLAKYGAANVHSYPSNRYLA